MSAVLVRSKRTKAAAVAQRKRLVLQTQVADTAPIQTGAAAESAAAGP